MLQVKNLSAAYGQSQVLHGIDFEVQPGEIVALVGRNGMGKSTLMKSLIGVMPARSGQIVVDGNDVVSLPSHQRVKTAELLKEIIKNRSVIVIEHDMSGTSATSASSSASRC